MTCATSMSDKTLKYVNSLQDEEQFPGARCSQDPENVFMYGRTASSSVESMNQANKPARDRTAVDVMQSMKLILDLESRRFDQKKKMAHEWTDVLTPYGNMWESMMIGGLVGYPIVIAQRGGHGL